MAVNPLIALQAQTPNIAQTTGNVIANIGNYNAIRENQQMSGVRKQMALSEADQARLNSLAITAGQVVPMLESNDFDGTKSLLVGRRDQLSKLGLSTEDLDEAISLVDQNPALLHQRMNQALQLRDMFAKGGESLFAPTPAIDREGKEVLIQASNRPDGRPRVLDFAPVDKADVAGRVERSKITARESTATGKADLASKEAEAEQGKAKLADRERSLQAEITRAQDVKSLVDKARSSKVIKNYYGAVAGRTPPVRQETLDLQADIERIISLASLAARGELKGQGPVSDFEGRLLANAQTVLSNRLISPERAEEEMDRLSDLMQDIMSRGEKAAGQSEPSNEIDALINKYAP